MDLQATYSIDAPASRVWAHLIAPAAVAACLPGCDRLEELGNDTWRAKLNMTVAAISGSYDGTVAILDKNPPTSYRLRVDGNGRSGFVKGEASIELLEENGKTTVTVRGTAEVGGLIARVGQRLLGSVSKMMMDRFFDCMARSIATLT